MRSFAGQLKELKSLDCRIPEAEEKVAHDAVPYAIRKSGLKKNENVFIAMKGEIG